MHEAGILKRLRELPTSLSQSYRDILAECQKGRSESELAALQRLLAWLAHCNKPLTLGETSYIVGDPLDTTFDIENELEGKCAGLVYCLLLNNESSSDLIQDFPA